MTRTKRLFVAAAMVAVSFASAAPADAAYAWPCRNGTGVEFGVATYSWQVCV